MEFVTYQKPNPYFETILRVQVARTIGRKQNRPIFVVHVGGHNGAWDEEFCRHFRRIRLYSIEPHPKSFVKLMGVALRCSDKMQAFHLAIHPKVKKLVLYQQEGSKQNTSQYSDFVDCKTKANRKPFKVDAMSLGSFFKDNGLTTVDLLRINCEGGEFDLFAAADVTWLDCVNVLAVTWHGKSPVFLTDAKTKIKIDTTAKLKAMGFALLYGHDYSTMDKLPIPHQWQIWVRGKVKV